MLTKCSLKAEAVGAVNFPQVFWGETSAAIKGSRSQPGPSPGCSFPVSASPPSCLPQPRFPRSPARSRPGPGLAPQAESAAPQCFHQLAVGLPEQRGGSEGQVLRPQGMCLLKWALRNTKESLSFTRILLQSRSLIVQHAWCVQL